MHKDLRSSKLIILFFIILIIIPSSIISQQTELKGFLRIEWGEVKEAARDIMLRRAGTEEQRTDDPLELRFKGPLVGEESADIVLVFNSDTFVRGKAILEFKGSPSQALVSRTKWEEINSALTEKYGPPSARYENKSETWKYYTKEARSISSEMNFRKSSLRQTIWEWFVPKKRNDSQFLEASCWMFSPEGRGGRIWCILKRGQYTSERSDTILGDVYAHASNIRYLYRIDIIYENRGLWRKHQERLEKEKIEKIMEDL